MKLLLVTWHFPPVNAIAAVRTGKFARYMARRGHDIRILTADRPEPDRSLPLELDEALVVRTPYLDIDRLLDRRRDPGRQPGGAGQGMPPPAAARPGAGWRRRLGSLYRGLAFLPDRQVGWGRHLLPRLRGLLGSFAPDIVLASGPPFSPLLWTALALRGSGVPWVAELRDRWTDDTYKDVPAWREPLDRWLERRVLRRAAGIVTVSEPWRAFYARKYGLPAATVMNGFDPGDFAGLAPVPQAGLPLRVLHVGTIYRDRRDPRPLLDAVRGGGFGPEEVRLVFYGQHLDWVRELAAERGLEALIELGGTVPYREALRLQAGADILLLLQWNRPSEVGNVPGKLFEYLATGRPILGLGPEAGVPARLIGERRAGLFANEPGHIADYLRRLLAEKRATGQVAPLPAAARHGLTRDEQYAVLEGFLAERLAPPLQSGTVSSAFPGRPSGKTGGFM